MIRQSTPILIIGASEMNDIGVHEHGGQRDRRIAECAPREEQHRRHRDDAEEDTVVRRKRTMRVLPGDCRLRDERQMRSPRIVDVRVVERQERPRKAVLQLHRANDREMHHRIPSARPWSDAKLVRDPREQRHNDGAERQTRPHASE